ncbi:MAG: hypothetical protein K2I83_01550 [Bacteroidales bacterium]|nr:hypothetical protein [Bacteroidales bacterium]
MADILRDAGIKVHEVSAEQAREMANRGQKMSAAKKRALDTAVGSLRNGQATVMSSAEGTKIQKNLDELSKVITHRSNHGLTNNGF